MAADGIVQVPADSVGKKIDTSELMVGGNTVERQRVVNADPNDPSGLGGVVKGDPPLPDSAYAVLVRELREENAVTQMILGQIAGLLAKVFGMTAAAGMPALNVQPIQATAANMNATVTCAAATAIVGIGAIGGFTSPYTVLGAAPANSNGNSVAMNAALSTSYPLPMIPEHLYGPGAISV